LRYWNGPWTQAVKDAADQYGFTGQYATPAGDAAFDLTEQNALIDSLAAKGANAFGVFPGDVEGTNAQLDSLQSRGIPSITINGCTNDPSPALFCLSTDVGPAAQYQAEQLIKAIGGKGEIALLTSQVVDPNTELRVDAVKQAVADTDGDVELAQIITDPGTPEQNTSQIRSMLASKGDSLDGVMSTSETPAVAMATIMKEEPQYQHIKYIAAENSDVVMDGVSDGTITGTLWQNTYGMGYVASYVLYKVVQEGCEVSDDAPFDSNPQTDRLIKAAVEVIDQSNIDDYDTKLESLPDDTDRLMTLMDDKVLSC